MNITQQATNETNVSNMQTDQKKKNKHTQKTDERIVYNKRKASGSFLKS